MPELPEVETIARQLQRVLPERMIEKVEVLREKSFGGEMQDLPGKVIKRVKRKAKMLIVEFEDWEKVGLIHLKMTGQLIFEYAQADQGKRIIGGHPTPDWVNRLPSSHTRVILRFKDGSTLYFNDQRVFGWVKVATRAELAAITNKLPPDVIDDEFTLEYFSSVLKRSQRPIKLVLLDQSKMGGLGNIYVNDALWLAHTKPTRKANSLNRKETKALYEASRAVLRKGIELGGASETNYVHIDGMGGSYQHHFLTYKREGEQCLDEICGATIAKIKLGGRGTYYCPKCQK